MNINLCKSLLLVAILGSSLLAACSNKDLYNEENSSTTKKDASSIFDFSTKKTVNLTIDYGFSNYVIPFSVCLNNTSSTSNEPIYSGCTDKAGKFSGSISIPSMVDTVFVCSNYIGVPEVAYAVVKDGAVTLDLRSTNTKSVSSRAVTHINIGAYKEKIGTGLYTLYNTYDNNYYTYYYFRGIKHYTWNANPNFWMPSNTKVPSLYSEVANTEVIADNSDMSDMLSRINSSLRPAGKKIDNSSKIPSDDKHVNVAIAKMLPDNVTPVASAHIDLVYVNANGDYHNAMAYYYYPTSKEGSLTANYIKSLPKYVVFPRTTKGPIPNKHAKARLQFFGDNYDKSGTDDFPAGYSIGWMLIPDLAATGISDDDAISMVNNAIASNISYGKVIYSNRIANTGSNPGCIAWTDSKTGKVVLGFEDQAFEYKNSNGKVGDNSYEDILFYVDSDPIGAIVDPDRPIINPTPDPVYPDQTSATVSTLAFEDIWPNGGDYDMNDVVVEWKTTVTSNNNNIKQIVDEFKTVQKAKAATKANALGFVINDNYGGTISAPATFTKEENNQYIIYPDAKLQIGKSYTFTRTFAGSYPSIQGYTRNYNLFICPDYVAGAKNRIEVHLPKAAATSWASSNNGGENAYYVNADGKYPFAIELNDVTGFNLVTERSTIGSVNEYPLFNSWVESKGTKNADWYLYKNGK